MEQVVKFVSHNLLPIYIFAGANVSGGRDFYLKDALQSGVAACPKKALSGVSAINYCLY
jgi:hypothetical protein